MRLPAIRQDTGTAGKIAATQDALATAKRRLARLRDDREAARGKDDIAKARKLDPQIAEQRQAVATYTDGVASLQARLANEQREQRNDAHLAGVARIETELLPPRAAAAAELANALKVVAAAVRKMTAEAVAIRANWPAIYPRPRHVAEYHQALLSTDRALSCIDECFKPMITKAAGWSMDAKIGHIERKAGDFAAAEAPPVCRTYRGLARAVAASGRIRSGGRGMSIPSQAATAAEELNVAPAPPATVADVWAERARLVTDPEWKAAFEKGDPAKRTEMNRVMSSGARWGFGETVNPADFCPQIAEQVAAQRADQVAVLREQAIDDMRTRAAIPEDVAKMVREGKPVAAHEKRWAAEERDRLFADGEWVKRWRAGDRAAQSELALLQIVRAAPVKAA